MFAGEYKGKPRWEDFSSFSLPQERQNSQRMFVVPLGVCPSPGRLLPCCAPPGEVEDSVPLLPAAIEHRQPHRSVCQYNTVEAMNRLTTVVMGKFSSSYTDKL